MPWLKPRGVLVLLCAVILLSVVIVLSDRGEWDWHERLSWFSLLSFYGTWVVLLTLALLKLTERGWRKCSADALALLALVFSCGVALLILGLAQWWLGWTFDFRHYFLNASVVLFLGMFVWLVVSSALSQARQEKDLLKARYDALVARLEPHFLFNALNTIAALLPDRAQDAESALVKLSGLLRATLGAPERWSLAEEVEMVRNYLSVESLRFGGRLRVRWDVSGEPDLEGFVLPRGVLLPLVENAVRHGLKVGPTEMTIALETAHEQGLRLVVCNRVVQRCSEPGDFRVSPVLPSQSEQEADSSEHTGFGIGLTAVKVLVETARGHLRWSQENGTFCVQVWLPRESDDASLGRRG